MEYSSVEKKNATRPTRSESSEFRDKKNNGIKGGLLVDPELPEYTASLTSLLGLILVTELTRGGAEQSKNPLQTRRPHAKNANSFGMQQ